MKLGVNTLTVELEHHVYEVMFEHGDQGLWSVLPTKFNPKVYKVALISDEQVASCYQSHVVAALQNSGYQVEVLIVPVGESSKSFVQVELLCEQMAQRWFDRHSLVIALGGGVVGDLAGYVASIYMRGVPFIQMPTSLLAMVDSSVGGKTGINLKAGKNLVGSFYQPQRVHIDLNKLKTLSPRELKQGMAEMIKHALIQDEKMLDELEKADVTSKSFLDLIKRNIAIKTSIVEQDEFETKGQRAFLNFGHTLGHAIEAAAGYGQLFHGEAISLGMRAALFLSELKYGLSPLVMERTMRLLHEYQLPTDLNDSRIPSEVNWEKVLELMKTDKKFTAGKMRWVLLKAVGEPVLTSDVTLEEVRQAFEQLRLGSN
jgi:3-dehydroquinate synthase